MSELLHQSNHVSSDNNAAVVGHNNHQPHEARHYDPNTPTHISDPYNLQETITFGTICAAGFFYLNVMLHNRFNHVKINKDEYGQRIISFLHAALVSVGCLIALALHNGGWYDSPATRLEGDVCMFSFAYFAVDTLVMVLWKFDLMYCLHHFVALRWLSMTALFGQLGFGGCLGLFAAELVNPLMHGRWLLHADGKSDSLACKICTKLWFPVFFFLRLIVIPGLMIYNYHLLPTDILVILTVFTIASVKFFYDAAKAELKGEWWEG